MRLQGLLTRGRWLAFGVLLLVLTNRCQPKEAPDLCDCVPVDEQGNWDMHLSEGCIQQFIDRFGEDLHGMERWFRDSCSTYRARKEKPEIQA
ncbi:hypothetical protein SAMN05421823_102574 [Catalinimonas alkaloidigena]|uniref:Uncharacterized protein n=2 Tax=Catalinimonas alkaloidigena TaxID=1075417 RepID=A0A1G9BD44_9BACT|nr:hypothetical protein SAMN05421823_102574 [Catalinimonas alkaloidigena]